MSFREYQAGGDFADSFIAAVNRREGCAHTVTFDRKAGRRPGFVLGPWASVEGGETYGQEWVQRMLGAREYTIAGGPARFSVTSSASVCLAYRRANASRAGEGTRCSNKSPGADPKATGLS
jgi:hypothetical protein